jgi:osmotically-inducible protein OsmY
MWRLLVSRFGLISIMGDSICHHTPVASKEIFLSGDLKLPSMRSDTEILNDLMNQLIWEPILYEDKISVAVKDGIVTLSGHVDRYAKKMAAEKAAKKIAGVKVIAEIIEVGKQCADKTDVEIAELILQELGYHTAIKEESVKIKVEHGIVTLEGEVAWAYQRFAIKREIEKLPGVKHVNNYISVKPKLQYPQILHTSDGR